MAGALRNHYIVWSVESISQAGSDIVQNTYDNFFVGCSIQMISDLRSFVTKLSEMSGIYKISAKVNPPNPLFGPLWKDLKEYLEIRRSDQMLIREESTDDIPLNSDLKDVILKIIDHTDDSIYENLRLPIGDAAILMAADGYGTGLVRGVRNSEMVTVKTSDTNRNFDFSRNPDPEELFHVTYRIFKSIETERHMEH